MIRIAKTYISMKIFIEVKQQMSNNKLFLRKAVFLFHYYYSSIS